jgi:hypothetical protein
VLFLGFTFVPLDKFLLIRFVIGGLLLIVGLTVFLLGVDLGIQPMGERCGAELTKKRSLVLLLTVAFVIGFIVTAAEPDIQVFGGQVCSIFPFVNKLIFTFVIAGGVGLFIMFGLLRTVLNLSLKWSFFIAYALLFVLAFFAPSNFTGIAFDSGGVASGPMTSTFILSFTMGIAQASSGMNGQVSFASQAFGVIALVAMMPLLAIQIMGIIFKMKQRKAARVQVNNKLEVPDEL